MSDPVPDPLGEIVGDRRDDFLPLVKYAKSLVMVSRAGRWNDGMLSIISPDRLNVETVVFIVKEVG